MDTYQLNEQQQRLAETFYNDYSLIKFGAYGEEYLYTVCDVDTRKYHALRERPDYRRFQNQKRKQNHCDSKFWISFQRIFIGEKDFPKFRRRIRRKTIV